MGGGRGRSGSVRVPDGCIPQVASRRGMARRGMFRSRSCRRPPPVAPPSGSWRADVSRGKDHDVTTHTDDATFAGSAGALAPVTAAAPVAFAVPRAATLDVLLAGEIDFGN